MYDITMRQLDDRMAECQRMMDRVNGPRAIAPPPSRLTGVREAIARSLLSLATRLAPLTTESHTA